MQHAHQSSGQKILQNTIFTLMRKTCTSCIFKSTAKGKRTSEDIVLMCCFHHVQQQLSDKLQAMEIKDLTNRLQALEFTNEEQRQAQQHKF